MTIRRPLVVCACLAAVAWVSAAVAGPPGICHPVEIGEAQSLPWGNGPFSKAWRYDRGKLVKETLAILASQDDTLVHIETLRRAAIYVDNDRELGMALLAALQARVLDAEMAGKTDALAWFDVGYLVQCYDQYGRLALDVPCGTARGVVGYGWVRHALELSGDNGAMEFGAAIMTATARIPEHREHAVRARTLAASGSLVATNVERHANAFWHVRNRDHGG